MGAHPPSTRWVASEKIDGSLTWKVTSWKVAYNSSNQKKTHFTMRFYMWVSGFPIYILDETNQIITICKANRDQFLFLLLDLVEIYIQNHPWFAKKTKLYITNCHDLPIQKIRIGEATRYHNFMYFQKPATSWGPLYLNPKQHTDQTPFTSAGMAGCLLGGSSQLSGK